ncbi:MAG: hypothetical protein IKH04_00945 [Kiritimatiellae bacterium]|nr:hypothetical protein [Kiritimatiellia bacterium]
MSLKSKIEKLLSKWLQKLISRISPEDDNSLTYRSSTKVGTGGDAQDRAGDPSGSAPPDAADAVDYSLLDWRYGRFDGSKAALSSARIAGLRVTADGLSYKWTAGGCEDLDRACSHVKPCCTCALFCRVNGKWIGGKFDHISTDRRTRDFANIRESYGGWDPSALRAADAYAFVILDDGARRRTNVIVQEGGVR